MLRRNVFWCLVMGAIATSARDSAAQAPTLPTESSAFSNSTGQPGSNSSMMGRTPGSGGTSISAPAVGGGQILGGRAGTGTPRVPTSVSTPGSDAAPLVPPSVPAIPVVPPLTRVPLYGSLNLPSEADEGPADGLTFDAALGLLIQNNVELQARRFEIPLAQADVLTSSLRANPIVYGDSQLIPYGAYSNKRPGGPNQFDLNVSQPVDFSHKRQARIAFASKTKKAVELQYQDAVRVQIGNLANAYLGVLAARETLRYAEAGLQGIDRVLDATRKLQKFSNRTSADVLQIETQRSLSEVGVLDAQEGLRRAKRTLGSYLGIPPEQAETIEIKASIRDAAPPPPPIQELTAMALQCRPDVLAYRKGVEIAKAGLNVQYANRFADAYVLYQPYTFQNLSYLNHSQGATSWALGITIPLPVFNRNQGNIERAKLNIDQSKVQLVAVERMIIKEVRDAEQEYLSTKAYLEKLERTSVPQLRKAMSDTEKLFVEGETPDITPYLNVQKSFNDLIRQYRDTAIRHRRSMFDLNTAVGTRILP